MEIKHLYMYCKLQTSQVQGNKTNKSTVAVSVRIQLCIIIVMRDVILSYWML